MKSDHNILGVSSGYHDAAVTVIDSQGEIAYAGHAERYSKRKNDANLNVDMLFEAARGRHIDHIAYYETPWRKQTRQLYSGQVRRLSYFTAIFSALAGLIAARHPVRN